MWNEFKNKLKKWFDEADKNDTPQPEKQREYERSEMNAKTRMTYRYPKQGEFRFPVIPDPDQTSNDSNSSQETKPEKRERRRNDNEKHHHDKYEEKKERTKEDRRHTKNRKEDKSELPETSSIPFTPSDVPSPIYGYHSRQLTVGLEKLESTVVPNKEQETRALDDAEWQELRKRLRSRVTEDKERTSRNALQKQFERNGKKEQPKEGDPHARSAEWAREEAATLETQRAVKKDPLSIVKEGKSPYEKGKTEVHTEDEHSVTEWNHDTVTEKNEANLPSSLKKQSSSPLNNLLTMEEDYDEDTEEADDSLLKNEQTDEDNPLSAHEKDQLNEECKDEEESQQSAEVEESDFEKQEQTGKILTEQEPQEHDNGLSTNETGFSIQNPVEENESIMFSEETEQLEESDREELEDTIELNDDNHNEDEEQYLDFSDSESSIEEETEVNGEEPVEEENTLANESESQNSVETDHDQETKVETSDPQSDDLDSNHSPTLVETDEQKSEAKSSSNQSEKPGEEVKKQTPPRKKESSQKRTVPFNVIMTPRDKRSRDRKPFSKQEETKKENLEAQKSQEKVTIENQAVKEHYQTPLYLLEDPVRAADGDDQWIKDQMELLETTLRHFHVRAKVVNAMKGPTVTRFEVQPEPGVKVSKITNLADDIKLSMAARDIRIEAPIPGKQAVGIEVPNQQPQMVGLQEIFESQPFQGDKSPLSVGLGLDIGGDSVVTNLKKMPHGLIAGATGSGKSVCINTILISLLYKAHHEDVKFLLIDPKMVELAPYNDLPHLVSPVITDVKAATTALKWAVKEMEERYEKFVKEGVRDVERYNDKMIKSGRREEKMPYMVIVIDELADLMMVSPQDVEDSICRIAQKARACGMHLLLATQRPSVDVITGLIKANIPTRIAFSVSSQVDSRTIIDSGGAEKLLGKGDMLFVENGSGQPRRIQGAFVSDDEIERVTHYVKKIAPPNYLFHQEELMKQISSEEETDALFDEAVQFVVAQNGASASLLQRRFKVGYNRAARLIDQMEDYGIISEQKGSKPRDILLTEQQIQEIIE
ncbi:DNA translocase FtsK [Halobacillus mangrovi]|uniref:DNA translocase FtsK n=1 Tax=Halobacillus mangrovi TaxID=402384 RepID=UPI003D98D197